MNKSELANAIAEKAGLSKKDAAAAVDGFAATVQEALKNGDSVAIAGFGTFKSKKRAARTGRDPRSGREVKIPAKNAPSFTPGKTLKDALNA